MKYWCSQTDGHPNKLGHEKLAEVILLEIETTNEI